MSKKKDGTNVVPLASRTGQIRTRVVRTRATVVIIHGPGEKLVIKQRKPLERESDLKKQTHCRLVK